MHRWLCSPALTRSSPFIGHALVWPFWRLCPLVVHVERCRPAGEPSQQLPKLRVVRDKQDEAMPGDEEVLQRRRGDRDAVVGGGAAPELIDDHEAARDTASGPVRARKARRIGALV